MLSLVSLIHIALCQMEECLVLAKSVGMPFTFETNFFLRRGVCMYMHSYFCRRVCVFIIMSKCSSCTSDCVCYIVGQRAPLIFHTARLTSVTKLAAVSFCQESRQVANHIVGRAPVSYKLDTATLYTSLCHLILSTDYTSLNSHRLDIWHLEIYVSVCEWMCVRVRSCMFACVCVWCVLLCVCMNMYCRSAF